MAGGCHFGRFLAAAYMDNGQWFTNENINNSHLLPASRVVVDVITMIMMVHSIDNAT